MYSNSAARQGALGFAAMGYPVLPLHGVSERDGALRCTCGDAQCPSPGKHPFNRIAPHGVKDATTDAGKIRAWPHSWLNFGVATDRLLVVDVDARHGGLDTWRKMWRQSTRHLPLTWEVLTGGGGKHILFANPGDVKSSMLAKGVDVKGAGGYIVGVGSMHVSGKQYRWAPQCAPNETALATPPQWLLDELHADDQEVKRYPSEHWEKIITEPLTNGARNNQLIQVIGHLLSVGVDPFLAHELIQCWNMQRGNPPEDNERVSALFNRVMAYEENKCR